jgi:hypothetical protein
MRPLTVALTALTALAACSGPPGAYATQPQTADLSAEQLAALRDLGAPVLLPDLEASGVAGFRLVGFAVERRGLLPSYALDYTREADGACFEISGSSEGLGGPRLPLVYVEVPVPGIPGGPTVRVFEASGDPGATSAQVWGRNTVVSDYIALDEMTALFLSDTAGGCRPVGLREGARIVGGLRLLPPAGDAAPPEVPDLGPFARADDLLGGYNAGATPTDAARALADRYEAERTETQVLSEFEGQTVVLVTAYGLYDDSVRDERLQLVYVEGNLGAWELVEAGRQVRCYEGRGHTDWGPEPFT